MGRCSKKGRCLTRSAMLNTLSASISASILQSHSSTEPFLREAHSRAPSGAHVPWHILPGMLSPASFHHRSAMRRAAGASPGRTGGKEKGRTTGPAFSHTLRFENKSAATTWTDYQATCPQPVTSCGDTGVKFNEAWFPRPWLRGGRSRRHFVIAPRGEERWPASRGLRQPGYNPNKRRQQRSGRTTPTRQVRPTSA
jgi:hypothetical protein